MTSIQLKYKTRDTSPNFFSNINMRMFGDTMENFGVKTNIIDGIKVFELYRKEPVRGDLQSSHYFRMDNFEEVFIND